MRRLFTIGEARAEGMTEAALRWGERRGAWTRIVRGIYGEGPQPPTPLDNARAKVLRKDAVARGSLAGVLHELDSVLLTGQRVARQELPPERVTTIAGVRCADGVQTLIDLAAALDDLVWEQALESALRKKLTTIAALQAELPRLAAARTPGTARIRRVLAKRPPGAPATESLLETLMVQLARTIEGLVAPTRQYEVYDEHGQFVARVDLAWPDLALFVELDGQHHPGQPVHDARRQTAVTAAMGWLCGRFTWYEVTRCPRTTARRLAALAAQGRRLAA